MVNGESLAEDMEGCGDELVLKRVCAPGGEGPKVLVEIIRSRVEDVGGLLVGRGAHWTSSPFCAGMTTRVRIRSQVCVWVRARRNATSGKWELMCTPAVQC